MFQIAPTTFHGIRSGIDISTRHTDAHRPRRGIASAIAMPSGTSISRTMAVNSIWRRSAPKKRGELTTSSNHLTPSKKNRLFPNVSCTE